MRLSSRRRPWIAAMIWLLAMAAAAAPRPGQATEYLWKFTIPAMHDGDRAMAVFDTLENIPGVREINANLDNFSMRFIFDDDWASLESIQRQIEELGLPVREKHLLQEPCSCRYGGRLD